MSEIKVNSIKGVAASAAAISVDNSNGTCTLASGSKLNNCTTDGTTNFTIADGNLVFSTNGHGIDFSANTDAGGTATSQLLEDYEEGTFVPTLGSWVSIQTVYSASYVKIGNLVTVTVYIVVGSNSSSDQFILNNLPYTVKNVGSGQYPVGSCYLQTDLGYVFAQVNNNTTNAYIYKTTGQVVNYSQLSGLYALFTVTYSTT